MCLTHMNQHLSRIPRHGGSPPALFNDSATLPTVLINRRLPNVLGGIDTHPRRQ